MTYAESGAAGEVGCRLSSGSMDFGGRRSRLILSGLYSTGAICAPNIFYIYGLDARCLPICAPPFVEAQRGTYVFQYA